LPSFISRSAAPITISEPGRAAALGARAFPAGDLALVRPAMIRSFA
jgi:hypothetical protein